MKRRVISQTMLKVSPLCLGTTTFGAPVDKVEATRIVHWALDHGINFIDTDTYEGYGRQPSSAGGVAESFLGDVLEEGRQPSLNGTDNLKTMALVDACHRAAKEDKQLDDHSFGSDDGEGGTVRLSLWNHPGEGIYGAFARCERLVGAAEQILQDEPYHSKVIMKDARVGGAWTWHQDYG